MTKPVLGTKRLCAGCNAKFYDLLKSPIVCPMCEAVFVVPKPVPPRSRRGEPLPAAIPVVAAPAIAAKSNDASTGDEADGEKEAEAGVPLLEIDEED